MNLLDSKGKELFINDNVVISIIRDNYNIKLDFGIVSKISDKSVLIQCDDIGEQRFNCSPKRLNGNRYTTKVVKIFDRI